MPTLEMVAEIMAVKCGLKMKIKEMLIPTVGNIMPMLDGDISYTEFVRLMMKNRSFINLIYGNPVGCFPNDQKLREIALEPAPLAQNTSKKAKKKKRDM